MTGATLIRWPETAGFGRVVPKSTLYERASIGAAVREAFVADVERITWAFKLAESTIRLAGSAAVPEIQVFVVDAKGDDASDVVLAAIDRAVQFPIIFEVNRSGEHQAYTRMTAAHKELSGATPRLGPYRSTGWFVANAPRMPMPIATSLADLFTALLAPMMPISLRPGETLADAEDRILAIRAVERQVAALRSQMRLERQFNRRVEMRRALRQRVAELGALTASQVPQIEDVS